MPAWDLSGSGIFNVGAMKQNSPYTDCICADVDGLSCTTILSRRDIFNSHHIRWFLMQGCGSTMIDSQFEHRMASCFTENFSLPEDSHIER